jgi:NADH:ubiquinone oxidoreductase subunit C
MNRIQTSFENLKKDIAAFYKPESHHFITMNGVDLGNDEIEYQWFFCDYAFPSAITTFITKANADVQVPSIKNIVASAWVHEAELVDLLGIHIEDTKKGFVLEQDFETAPLRKK